MSEPLKPLPLEEHPWLKSLREMLDYYAESFSCVWRETRGFFGWNWRTVLVPALFLVGLILAFFTLEGEVVRDELLTTLAFGLAPVVGLAMLITLVNIIRAPYLLDAKQQSALATANQHSSEQLAQRSQEITQRSQELTSLVKSLEEHQKEVRHYKEQSRTCYGVLTEARNENAIVQQKIKELEFAKAEMEARFLPELSIAYKKDEEHYFQEYGDGIKQYRVAAVSTVAMNDAEMVANAVALSGGILNVRHSRLHMRPMHDRNERGTRRVIMKPFEYEFWDIVSEGTSQVWFNHIEAAGEGWLAPGKHEFELRITGGQKPAASSIVTVTVSDDHKVVEFKVREGRLSDRDPRGLVW